MSSDLTVTYVLDCSFSPSSSGRYFGGREPAHFAARSTHFPSSATVASPSGSTKTQAFIGRPVRSNTRVCGSARARPASSRPRRTMRASRCTPQHMFPCSKKVIPPNIFLSDTPLRLPRWARMPAASFSSNAIGPLAWWKRMPVRPPNDLQISCRPSSPRHTNQRSRCLASRSGAARGASARSGLSAAFAG
jgi:hypothetical protein